MGRPATTAECRYARRRRSRRDPDESVARGPRLPAACRRRVTPVGQLLPVLELVVGTMLVLGLLTRGAAVVSALLFVAFIIGIASVWARGITIDCGCFGGGGYDADAASKYPWEIARDVGLLAASLYLVWLTSTRLALDNVLFGRRRRPRRSLTCPSRATGGTGRARGRRTPRAAAPRTSPSDPDGASEWWWPSPSSSARASSSTEPRHQGSRATPAGPLAHRVRRHHRLGRRAARGRRLRGLPVPVLRGVRGGDARAAGRSWPTQGKVQVEYRPFVLLDAARRLLRPRRDGVRPLVLQEESAPDVAKKFHDLLFANQPSEEGPFPSEDELVDLAGRGGRRRGCRPRSASRVTRASTGS